MKRITLISLPAPFLVEPAMNPPLGLCYIGAALKKAGHEVKVIDFTTINDDYNKPDYLGHIPMDADIIGIYCTSAQFKWLKEVTKYISNFAYRCPLVVLGGPQASSQPEVSLRHGGVDLVVNGEGEEAIVAIADNKPWESIPGVCYLEGDKFIDGGRAFVKDLNSLPSPDYSLFNMDKYQRRLSGDKAFHIITLRGCPYRCNFCDSKVVGNSVRYISVEKVMSEIDKVIDTYGVKNFVIYDDIFTLRKKRIKEFCAEFKKRGIQWRCWSRADLLREDDLLLMRDSGLESIAMGIESGDAKVLKNINKRTTVEDNRKALKLCKKLGVPVRCSLMFGNPGECLESLDNTVELIRDTQPDEWNLSILMPSPGSEFWDNPEKYGLHFDKEKIIQDDYQVLNRTGESGMGWLVYSLDSMSDSETKVALKDFVDKLEEACPRTKIRDVIQELKI